MAGGEKLRKNAVNIIASLTLLAGALYLLISGNSQYLLAFCVILVNAYTGLFVLSQNPRNRLNQIFCLLTFELAAWSFCLSVFQVAGAMLWGRLTYAFASLIPPVFMSFVRIFPKYEEKAGWTEYSTYLLGAVFSCLAFTDIIIKGVSLLPWGFTLDIGPNYSLFAAYFLGVLLVAFGKLFSKYRTSAGSSRIQIMYVFLGTFTTALLGIAVAIVLPLLGFARLYSLAPPATFIMIGFIAYAIVKHRLMSIEVVIQRSTVYTFATVLIMSVYALAVIFSETFLRSVMGYSSLLITAAAALLIAVIYQPLVRGFQNLTDQLFFRGRYDYQKTLREISHKIASVIKLEELTKLIVSSFIDTMRISEISLLLPEKEGEHFRSVPLAIPRYKRIEIDINSPIISWLTAAKDILIRDEIEDEIARQETSQKGLEEVRDEMERLGISVWVPVISKDALIGIIALGNKLSGDLFTSEDLGLLNTLANQTAVALDNARLYDEVVSMKNYSEEILQSMTNGVLTTDSSGRIVTCNHMAERITGRKADEVMGKTCEEVWGKRGIVTAVVERTLKDRCYVNFESSIASPERGLVPVAISSTLLRDGQGKKAGALLSIQDLTEVKELEDKVRRADKLTALATMAAGMAHEIKNPLSSMKVFTQLLPTKFDDPEYRQKLEEILTREIGRIDRIVESLLGFARATAPTFEKVKIEALLEETLKYFQDKAQNAGINVKKSYAELPEIEVDRGQIAQVFSNLILNAIQAMPEGGELSVMTLPGKKVEDLLQSVKIQIEDTGPGIPEEMQKKLFDPFFTTKYGGTGLGLTISHSVVDGHKGFIDVQSKIGKGTAFTVTLPVSQGLV
jgi:PAS domain S-box-containing protein